MAVKKQGSKKSGNKSRATRKPSVRTEKLIEGVLQGKTPPEAAREAGFSESYARVDVYRTLANPSIQERIQARQTEAKVEANEIIGTLASHMRGDLTDLLPDEDEIRQRAKERGISHLIKKIKVKTRYIPNGPGKEPDKEVTHEFEMYSAQEAAKQLCAVFGLNKEAAKNPFDAAKDALATIMRDLGLSQAEAAPIVAKTFGVSAADLISEAVN
jgi:phage terminase small subunit